MTRLRHLVVLIPGIGGSALSGPQASATRSTGPRRLVPGTARYALTPAGLARTLVWPDGLDIDRHPQLTPTGLVRDFTVLAPLLTLPGYQRLNAHLRNTFDNVVIDTYQPPAPIHDRTDVLRFPYDFRQSIEAAATRLDAAVDEALGQRAADAPDRPVIIVAHSMGGLVARYWLAVLGGWRRCAALLTAGTPYRGAPKALDWLVNGAGVGAVRDRRLTRVIRKWPSVYELLPQYEAVWDATAGAAGSGAAVELTTLPDAMLPHDAELAGHAARFAAMAAAGRKVHDEIRAGWAAVEPAQAPQLVAFFARGHATPNLVTLQGGRLRVSKDDPPWRGNVGWRGDGTVPMLSAIPIELGERQDLWRVRTERHGELGSIFALVAQLSLYAGERVPTRGGPLPQRPWLGLDVDEFARQGAEIPVEAALLPEPLRGEQAAVTLTPLGDTPGGEHRDRLARAAASGASVWRGRLPPRPPGRYEVAVEVMGVPGHGSVAGSTTIVVLDPGEADEDGGR